MTTRRGPPDGMRLLAVGDGDAPRWRLQQVGALVPDADLANSQNEHFVVGAWDFEPGEEDEAAQFETAKQHAGVGFASPKSGVLVLANTLLGGSGMLAVPHALANAGYLLGLALLWFFGCASAFGCHLLQCVARKVGRAPCTFYTVSNAVAPRWTWLIDGAVMVKCFGVGTSYLIIVGDLAPDAARFFGAGEIERWHAVTVGFAVAGTLSCFRNLSGLAYTAIASMCIAAWTAALIVLFAVSPGGFFEPCGEGAALPCGGATFEPFAVADPLELCRGLPVFIFGFTCHQNIFTICNEVKDASRRTVDYIIISAYAFSGVAFASSAIFAYATHGNKVASDVLKGYPQTSAVELTRLLFCLLAIFSYPLQAHPSRNSAISLWNSFVHGSCCGGGARGAELTQASKASEDPGAPAADAARAAEHARLDSRRFAVATVVGLALSYAIAIKVTDLGMILAVVGATGSTMVSYILPGMLYVKSFPRRHLKRYFALCQLGLGCVIMPVSLALILY